MVSLNDEPDWNESWSVAARVERALGDGVVPVGGLGGKVFAAMADQLGARGQRPREPNDQVNRPFNTRKR
jgi:hypothetical protein